MVVARMTVHYPGRESIESEKTGPHREVRACCMSVVRGAGLAGGELRVAVQGAIGRILNVAPGDYDGAAAGDSSLGQG